MLASALSMGSGAYLATKAEREVNESEISKERQELAQKPEEEQEELALFYQLKGVPEAEARQLAARLVAQPETALKTLASEELGLSEQAFPNPNGVWGFHPHCALLLHHRLPGSGHLFHHQHRSAFSDRRS
jgi:VIT1/CCC1 family predicted Fe2+/Mn2+ transporter